MAETTERMQEQKYREHHGAGQGSGRRPDPQEGLTLAAELPEQNIDTLERTCEKFWTEEERVPFARGFAKANQELVGLMSRRARAVVELPAHLMRCSTPQDAIKEQSLFVKRMLDDYQRVGTKMIEAWTSALPGP